MNTTKIAMPWRLKKVAARALKDPRRLAEKRSVPDPVRQVEPSPSQASRKLNGADHTSDNKGYKHTKDDPESGRVAGVLAQK